MPLKGLHKVKRKLADGSTRVHFYAWRGGPRIEAEPGTAAFMAEWQALTADRDREQAQDKISLAHHAGTFQEIINGYQRSSAFTDLRDRTRADYAHYIRQIEARWGSLPIAVLSDPRIRGDFLDWRDKIAETHKRKAEYSFAVLARIVSWAYDRRRITHNPCERPGRVYRADRADCVWSDTLVDLFLGNAAPAVALPFQIALWTGQREGDILALTWSAYDGKALRLVQSKTGRHITVPVAAPLRAILEPLRANRQAVTICTTSRGKPWTLDGYKSSFGKAKDALKIAGLTFHDLRGTAATRLALAGCSVPEIAAITGHSLKDVEAILDRHYLSRDRGLGETAIRKLETAQNRGETVNGASE